VGSRCQRFKGKRKRRAVLWAATGGLGGPAGLAGPKGERVRFSLFFFSFSNYFLKQLFFSNSNQNSFKVFSQKFINFLETTQATKNHASQLMMHNHLLSLFLLNYV
jgi:hypothetical protein